MTTNSDTNTQTRQRRFTAWRAFHRANPIIFDLFLRFTRHAVSRSHVVGRSRRKIGARLVGERIRWETTVETVGSEYKINNNFWPYYARLAMLVDENLTDVFERRGSRFDATDVEILAAHTQRN